MIRMYHTCHRPVISVVMTVYNPHLEFFRQALTSILTQEFADWELIIVEDPSPRSVAATLRRFSDHRIRYIANPERTCLVEQKNRGLSEARGQFIAIMDADDIARPFRFIKQLNFLRNHPDVGVVGSQVGVIDADDRLVGYRWFPTLHDDIRRAITRIVPFCHPTIMLRREVIDSFGGYRFVEFPAAEDYEYWSRLIQGGVRFANIPEPLLYYRIHQGQIKLSKLRETISAVLRVRELYWADELDLWGRFQVWAERTLLYLPKSFVARLLVRRQWNYRPRASCSRIAPATRPRSRGLGAGV